LVRIKSCIRGLGTKGMQKGLKDGPRKNGSCNCPITNMNKDMKHVANVRSSKPSHSAAGKDLLRANPMGPVESFA